MFTSLLCIADNSDNVDEFLAQARDLPIDGLDSKVAEAEQWLSIALNAIEEEQHGKGAKATYLCITAFTVRRNCRTKAIRYDRVDTFSSRE